MLGNQIATKQHQTFFLNSFSNVQSRHSISISKCAFVKVTKFTHLWLLRELHHVCL